MLRTTPILPVRALTNSRERFIFIPKLYGQEPAVWVLDEVYEW